MIGQTTSDTDPAELPETPAGSNPEVAEAPAQATEHGGRDGPEPTRYGDWEKNGRCIDF